MINLLSLFMKKMNRFNKKNQVLSLSLVLMLLSGLTAQNAYSSDLLVTHTGSVTFMASSGSSMDGCLSYGNSYSSYAVLRSDLPSYPVRLSGTNDNVTEVDPPQTPTVEAVQVISCGESVVLSIVNPNAAYTYNWYSDAECTQFVYTGISFTTPVLHNNTTYYVKASVLSTFVQDFSYTGDVQSFVIPQGTSELTLEVWGAAGGYYSTNGGSGGYAAGTLTDLSGISTLYVYVGAQGSGSGSSGGYNGGGNSNNFGGSGGGATDISTDYSSSWQSTTHYNSRLIVAGGGGGAGYSTTIGGYGGGTSGGQGGDGTATGGYGGGQSSPGSNNTAGLFGSASTSNSNNGGGGGGGWYGGASGINSGTDAGGGGGSGYVNTSSSYHPSGYIHSGNHFLTNTSLIAGNSSMPNPSGGVMTGNTGNGYARISYYAESGCPSVLLPVTVTVQEPETPIVADAIADCGTSVTLEVQNAVPTLNYKWYDDAQYTNLVNEGPTFTVSPENTTTYYVRSSAGSEGDVIDFTYTGSPQTFTVPSGVNQVTLEVWGAQGGDGDDFSSEGRPHYGGKGGYSYGTLNVNSGSELYIYVGQQGLNNAGTATAWNGGGAIGVSSYDTGTGGGATDIRVGGSSLNDRVIVAGGGGGGGNNSIGGAGGGLSGEQPATNTQFYSRIAGIGGTQVSGYQFGIGQGMNGENLTGGGGGGWYGGGQGENSTGGGGGSGYIGGVTNGQTIAGTLSIPNPAGGTMTGNTGNGFARITFISAGGESCLSPVASVTVTVRPPVQPQISSEVV